MKFQVEIIGNVQVETTIQIEADNLTAAKKEAKRMIADGSLDPDETLEWSNWNDVEVNGSEVWDYAVGTVLPLSESGEIIQPIPRQRRKVSNVAA